MRSVENKTMKETLIVFLVFLFIISGCKEIDKLTQFEMEYNETVVIPSSIGGDLPFYLFALDMESDSETTFAVNDTRKDLIEEIILTRMDLTITSPSNGDFGFLESINIFITADGLPDVKIAWMDNVPADAGKSLSLETTNSDLKGFLKKESFSLKITTVTDEDIYTDHHIDFNSVFFVDAKVLGQ